jgi:hypothetical protein
MLPGREADHSPPTNAEIKNTWIYAATLKRFHGRVHNYLNTEKILPFCHSNFSLQARIK